MKFCVTLSLMFFYVSLASCRPQTVQIERQNLLHLQRSVMKDSEQRGSLEETRRILQEIERINLSLGYKKRMTLAFPRVASGEGYFYPRQQFRPEFLTRPRENFNQNAIRMNNQRAIYPFNNQNYFYPTPYLQVPVDEKIHAFKSNKYFYPLVYAPINVMPYDYEKFKVDKEADGSIRLGTIVVLPSDESSERESKALESSRKAEATKKPESLKKSGRGKPKAEQSESSLIDQIVNYVPEALGLSDDDDDDAQDERQEIVIVSTTRLPIIKNDKYLNLALKKNQQEVEEDEENRKLPPPLPSNVNRAFNFSNPIEKLQNFTKQFTVSPTENLKEVTMVSSTASPDDIEDAAFDKAEIKEDEKSPFGFAFGPKQQLQTYKEGGLIIQRLRVRTGGIAIAGPGGVATAGSGGTAIVGPNGIAFTHPRGLAIGGPGARIYAVPETTDLEALALSHKARNLNHEGVLVARGPVIYFNEE